MKSACVTSSVEQWLDLFNKLNLKATEMLIFMKVHMNILSVLKVNPPWDTQHHGTEQPQPAWTMEGKFSCFKKKKQNVSF